MDTPSNLSNELEQFSVNLRLLIDELSAAGETLGNLRLGRPGDELMTHWQDTIGWLKNLAEHGLQMAVLGSFSSGKSTLINALLEVDCLPVGVQATTATVTRIRRSRNGKSTARVRYKTLQALVGEIAFQVIGDASRLAKSSMALTVEPADPPIVPDLAAQHPGSSGKPPSAWFIESYLPDLRHYLKITEPLGSGLEAGDRPTWQMGRAFLTLVSRLDVWLIQRLGQTEQLPLDDLAPVLADEERAICVDEVTIALEAPFLNGDLEIIDTPGLGSVHARHTRRAKEIAKSANLVAYVFPDRGPGDSDLEFLTWMHDVNKVLDPDKIFWIVNMVDKCVDDDARDAPTSTDARKAIEAHKRQIASELEQRGFATARVFPVSAECARRARLVVADNGSRQSQRQFERVALWLGDGDNSDIHENLLISGVSELSQRLRGYVTEHGGYLRRDATRRRVRTATRRVTDDMEQRSALSKLELQELEQLQREARAVCERVESGHNSELERTKRNLRGLVEDLGRDPLKDELDVVLNETAERVAEDWPYDWSTKAEAILHLGKASFRKLGFIKDGKSKLELHAEKVIEKALADAMERHNTREKFEGIHDAMRDAIAVELGESLKRIYDQLDTLEVRSQSGRQVRVFRFENRMAIETDIIQETLADLRDDLAAAFGFSVLGGGLFAADMLFTGGIISAVLGAISVIKVYFAVLKKYASVHEGNPKASGIDKAKELFQKIRSDIRANTTQRREAVKREFRDKLKIEIGASRNEIMQKAIEQPLEDYRNGLLDQYAKQVRDLLGLAEAQLRQAEHDLQRGRAEREQLDLDLGRAARLMLLLEHKLSDLMPEIAR